MQERLLKLNSSPSVSAISNSIPNFQEEDLCCPQEITSK